MKGRSTSSWIIITESTSTHEAMVPEKKFYPALIQDQSFGEGKFFGGVHLELRGDIETTGPSELKLKI
ncbi:hypothetical protein BGAL_0101g00180 [Botrytis galanthina]|uniref:Uncharacterized protein n=1 Tax=Botrytis galanthina TaxID=278940 RepID=A0A4V4HV35_9HELO|nr:hypothetical protein BGAL_0101g00180 [Botrytis galanthina]